MGLSTKELAQIKETLAAGRKPRVVFTESAGQIAGQTGHVVQLDDPSTQEDWILVKFGVDVLPFPPGDLAMAPRGALSKRVEPAPPPVLTQPTQPEFRVVREQSNGSRNGKASAKAAPPARVEKPPATKPVDKPVETIVPVSTPDTAGDTGGSAAPAPRKPAAGPKPPKVKPLPSFTVTLAYTEGEWTVGAVQGSKTLAKPYVIKPTEALKMVGLLDVPGVHEAVEHIMAAERTQAQAHAQKLRAELAELEAKLAELGA